MKNKKGSVFISIGVVLLVGALALSAYNIFDAKRAEKAALKAAEEMESYLAEKLAEMNDYTKYEDVEFIPDYVLYPEMEMPVNEIDGYDYIGVLEIPALDLSLPVLSEINNSLLKIAPCRYEGTAYLPGFVIGAHNYMSHFANLKLLSGGEEVVFRDNAGNTFTYEVMFCEQLKPGQTAEMKSDEWDLTLFTCTPGGQYRVTVRCMAKDELR